MLCLEKAMAPHSSTLAWKIPWMEEPGRLQSMGSLVSDTTEWLHFQFSLSCIGEGNGNPLKCSCLENPRDGAAWWAAVSGVAQSRTRLKRFSSSSSSLLFDCNHLEMESSMSYVFHMIKAYQVEPLNEFMSGKYAQAQPWIKLLLTPDFPFLP